MKRLVHCLENDKVDIELILLIDTILTACKEISFRVGQGALSNVLGSTLDENIQGETQKKLDIISNQLLKDMLLESGRVRTIASEEEDSVVAATEGAPYIVAFDPLDGSSNIDINGQIGTIFTIYRAKDDVPATSELQFAQQGTEQVCAGYVLYGPSTMLALTTGGPSRLYTLDRTQGCYLLTTAQLEIPTQTAEFAVNMSNFTQWSSGFTDYINALLLGNEGPRAKKYNMRWNGAMVGDVHRVLSRGGIFCYPSDTKNAQQPAKLRLLYEANPLAMLVENAQGKAFTEHERILTIIPSHIHQRVAVIMGSTEEVDACLGYLKPTP
ncbi:class 1 fructose-bisphosphatase [Colwellia sp. BRX8-7]|jgi:fructose-1,6-bisphosphatase I|uniref:class 1 fructose-bisphosphatase n=1 Tax=unclassified Colwellia TaxID=196834 RepID=UPI0015F3A852|nr:MULTISPECIES: class 1 fructose-bisphosphatase [unclassified Colwellia]MBA6338256.1 class 1 fructose-bisphosphatase [Colwellia sp. BRX8-7]MBA6347798.1 class 1 fructose-bisphosphatase [Colwellia sp. BRX8-9]MBA6383957.1 class 1 fructose-bisphosphatase [Colwellia sp. BRX10-9]MBA6395802.1 class 1 fructose-bisphosphatase [Colwellia sp. BRX10-6]|tara:strand:+ start:3604 stop:4581 length:978 start_codon:yes stop_codon:yes gene_type:complete